MKVTLKNITGIVAQDGLEYGRLNDWVNRGFITPAESSGVQGRPRWFTAMQAVGIVVAARLCTSEQGCVLPFVKTIVDAFSKVDEGWLLEEFKAGWTEFVTVHQGRLILDGKRPYGMVSVKYAYDAVMDHAQQVEVNT